MKKWSYLPEQRETSEKPNRFFSFKIFPYKKVRESVLKEELEEMIEFLRKKAKEQNGLYFEQRFQNKETGEIVKFINFRESLPRVRKIEDYSIVIYDDENALAEY